MARRALPEQSVLLQLLRYDGRSGRLYWRETDIVPRVPCRKPGTEALSGTTSKGYRRGRLLGHNLMAHRVIWKMLYGTEPDEIDHINGRKSDNRRRNLRDATRTINNRNSALRPSNKSGRIGVYQKRGRWVASIRHCGRQIWLGQFSEKAGAIAARAAAEIEYGYHPNHGRKPRF